LSAPHLPALASRRSYSGMVPGRASKIGGANMAPAGGVSLRPRARGCVRIGLSRGGVELGYLPKATTTALPRSSKKAPASPGWARTRARAAEACGISVTLSKTPPGRLSSPSPPAGSVGEVESASGCGGPRGQRGVGEPRGAPGRGPQGSVGIAQLHQFERATGTLGQAPRQRSPWHPAGDGARRACPKVTRRPGPSGVGPAFSFGDPPQPESASTMRARDRTTHPRSGFPGPVA
jgi:hypothetical protein